MASTPEFDETFAAAVRSEIGRRLRSRRQEADLTQVALAKETGLNNAYISEVERGRRNISMVNICRLASVLDCSPQELAPLEAPAPTGAVER